MIWWILFWVTIAYMKFKVEFSVFQEGHKKISPSIWPLLLNVKSTVKISLIFVAFLENMNFTVPHYRAEILTIFGLYFGRNEDFINSFWNLLTFNSWLSYL